MNKVIIGVLGLQGAIKEHEEIIQRAADELGMDLDLRRVTLPNEINEVDGLVMPGGESTAMILIGRKNGMLDAVRQKLAGGMPAFGTCAGAILLSKKVKRTPESDVKEGAFPFLDAEIFRNGYGRQKESFSTSLDVDGEEFRGIFIRAPVFGTLGENVIIHSQIQGDPVFIEQDNLFATTFHPELSGDTSVHKMFLKRVLDHKLSKN